MAWWRSGNAAVCKTAIRGFDSRPRLKGAGAYKLLCMRAEIERFLFIKDIKTPAAVSRDSRPRLHAIYRIMF